jgi:hypothetical protein
LQIQPAKTFFRGKEVKKNILATIIGAAVITTAMVLNINPSASAYTIKLSGPNKIQKGGFGNFTATFSETTMLSGWGVYKDGGFFGSDTLLATGTRYGADTIINFSLYCDLDCMLSGKNSEGNTVGSVKAGKPVNIFFRNFDTVTSTISNEIEVECVPEPLTLLGSATALGVGAFFKRKLKSSESSEKETINVG